MSEEKLQDFRALIFRNQLNDCGKEELFDYIEKLQEENKQLKEVIDKAQDFIRNEAYLNDSEIDQLAEILDSYRN